MLTVATRRRLLPSFDPYDSLPFLADWSSPVRHHPAAPLNLRKRCSAAAGRQWDSVMAVLRSVPFRAAFEANSRLEQVGLTSSLFRGSGIALWTLLGNTTPEHRLSTVLPAQPADVGIVPFEDAVIRDRCSQTFAVSQMPGSMFVAAGPTLGEGEVDHRS
jgi:hypothetical protein